MERFMHILEGVILFFCLAATVVAVGIAVYVCKDIFISKDNYSYVKDDGTSGTADYCENGKGGLYCIKDGRTFTVKEFSRK